jgi:DNA-binding GntR family transcriptional regulator
MSSTPNNHDVAMRLRDDIVSGTIPFGARITIDSLANRYGVSHMPVREALRELQGEGLVVSEPNRGARVRAIDSDFVVNLFEIRTALEVMLARRAAQHFSAADVVAVERIEDAIEEAIARRDFATAVAQNRAFHQHINQVAGNVDALPLVDRHWLLLAALWRSFGYGEERFAGVSNDHRHLIAALAARDQEATAVVMAAHTTKAKLAMLERMRRQGSAASADEKAA